MVVIERDEVAGGMPRFCDHPGFGMKDLHMVYSGPGYARSYVQRAQQADVDIRTSTTVTGWNGPTSLTLTSPSGLAEIEAKAVLLATGCRERPRAAQMIPGDRSAGVFTTSSLQHFIHGYHHKPGTKAVVVGAEIVSLSALVTLAGPASRWPGLRPSCPSTSSTGPTSQPSGLLADIWPRTQIFDVGAPEPHRRRQDESRQSRSPCRPGRPR